MVAPFDLIQVPISRGNREWGRLDFNLIHELRRLNGLPGHPDVEVPGVQANTGSLGMGISKAKGMVLAHRLQNKKAKVYDIISQR